jgi:hypothetical protein
LRAGGLFVAIGTFSKFSHFRVLEEKPMKRWTPEEISKLKSMAQKYPAAKVAEELGRGISATMVKAHELKLSMRYKKSAAGAAPAGTEPG